MPGGLISALGLARLKVYLESLGRYLGLQAVLILALSLLLVLAAGFGVTALTIWLTTQLGAATAFAVVASGFFVVALLVQVAILVRKRKRTRYAAAFGAEVQSDQMAFGSVAAMAVIGYLLGRQVLRH